MGNQIEVRLGRTYDERESAEYIKFPEETPVGEVIRRCRIIAEGEDARKLIPELKKWVGDLKNGKIKVSRFRREVERLEQKADGVFNSRFRGMTTIQLYRYHPFKSGKDPLTPIDLLKHKVFIEREIGPDTYEVKSLKDLMFGKCRFYVVQEDGIEFEDEPLHPTLEEAQHRVWEYAVPQGVEIVDSEHTPFTYRLNDEEE